MRLLKILAVLVIAALIGLTAYAYLGDMDPRAAQMRQPVSLDLSNSAIPPTVAATAPPTEAGAEPATEPDPQQDGDSVE